jgi:hypothetical protein
METCKGWTGLWAGFRLAVCPCLEIGGGCARTCPSIETVAASTPFRSNRTENQKSRSAVYTFGAYSSYGNQALQAMRQGMVLPGRRKAVALREV